MSDPHGDLEDQFLADMIEFQKHGEPLLVSLSPVEVITLIGYVQLALRHPNARGASAPIAAAVVQRLTDLVGITAAIREGIAAGHDPRHDRPVPAATGAAVVRPTVVCLCGSTRFKDEFRRVNLNETLCGRIVLSIGCESKSDAEIFDMGGDKWEDTKKRLDELHLRKIDLSDEILVIDVDGYIGDSTRREIAYAKDHGKRIRYWSLDYADKGAP